MADITVPIIPWEEITLGDKLGKGGFGVVFKGDWKHSAVAIKQIKGVLGEDAIKELREEAGVIAQLNSPFIIRLFGLCWEQQKYAIVMELMPNASLFHLLHTEQEISWALRYNIAQDIAYGLRLLHARKILHRDLSSLNVLLDNKLRAKLTDFGLAKVKAQSKTTSKHSGGLIGTIAWMAPELFGLTPKYSTASDVYAYGITSWELASREIPYQEVADPSLIKDGVKSGERAEIPADCPKSFAELIQACWSQESNKRPTMDMVVTSLSTIIQAELEDNTVPQELLANSAAADAAAPAAYQDNVSSLAVDTGTDSATEDEALASLLHDDSIVTPLASPGTTMHFASSDGAAAPAAYQDNISSLTVDTGTESEVGASVPLRHADNTPIPPPYSASTAISSQYSVMPLFLDEKAAAQTQHNLGMSENDQSSDHEYADLVHVQLAWYTKSAADGNAWAQYNLGIMYRDGEGVAKDYAQARGWFEKAAAKGSAQAQYCLGIMYRDGQGVTKDYQGLRKTHRYFRIY